MLSGKSDEDLLVFVDNGNGVYEPGVDTATFVDELPSDSDPLAVNTATVFVVASIPLAAVDSDAAKDLFQKSLHSC